jgi:outer membrane receptor for ferrienterochelin and colicins
MLTQSCFCSFVICASIAADAQAQQVDYNALQDVFGEPVTTSVTGSPQPASQAPADMQIITADDIRRSGATSIPEILNFVAGLDVRNYAALDSDVSIRGFSQPFNPRLLVLINGRQVYLDDYGYVAWQALPVQLSQIRQIEIVKGPASALFGFNAASGVINIITYDPLTDKTNVANVTLGTDGTLAGSLVSTINEPGKGGMTVSLGGLRTNEYSTASATSFDRTYVRPHDGNFNIDGRWKPTHTTEATLEITRSTSTSMERSPLYYFTRTSYRENSIKAGFAAETAIGLATIQGYINQGSSSLWAPSQGQVLAEQIDDLEANDLFKVANAHAIRAAVEYRDSRVFGHPFNGVLGYQDYAASLTWNWQVNPELTFTAAGRLDHLVLFRTDPYTIADLNTAVQTNNKALTEPSFNLGLVYQPTDTDTLRWLVGRSVQAPSLIDFGADFQFHFGPVIVLYAGNPDLKAETTTAYEMDYDKSLHALQSNLHIGVYFNQIRDILSPSLDVPLVANNGVLESYAENIGSGQALGGELGLQGANTAGWRWNVAYTLAAVTASTISAPPQTPERFANAAPVSVVDVGFGYSRNKFEADLQGKWQSRYSDYLFGVSGASSSFTPVTIPDFVTLNARLGYHLTPPLILAVSGQQLQAPQTIETAGLETERRILFSATYGF